MSTTTKTLPATTSSFLLKKALRRAFPGIKFSCRLSRGTAYGNVSVRWTDGPDEDSVGRIAYVFKAEGFDGMTDSSYAIETSIEVNGETFRSGLGLILLQRDASPAEVDRVVAELTAEGYVGQFAGSMHCAAEAILRGCEKVIATDVHGCTL